MNKRDKRKLELLIHVSKGTARNTTFLYRGKLMGTDTIWADTSDSHLELTKDDEDLISELKLEGLIELNGFDDGFTEITLEGREYIAIQSNARRRFLHRFNEHYEEIHPLLESIGWIAGIVGALLGIANTVWILWSYF